MPQVSLLPSYVPGDYDGDGKVDLAAFRPSSGQCWILTSSSGYATYLNRQWGTSTDVPVTGDWDGDAIDDLGIFRPSTGVVCARLNFNDYGRSSGVLLRVAFRRTTRRWQGRHRRLPPTGMRFVLKSSTNNADYSAFNWGTSSDIPILKR